MDRKTNLIRFRTRWQLRKISKLRTMKSTMNAHCRPHKTSNIKWSRSSKWLTRELCRQSRRHIVMRRNRIQAWKSNSSTALTLDSENLKPRSATATYLSHHLRQRRRTSPDKSIIIDATEASCTIMPQIDAKYNKLINLYYLYSSTI